MLTDDFGTYLARIDWGVAGLAFVAAVVAAAVLRRFLLAAVDELAILVEERRAWLAVRLRLRRATSGDGPWLCTDCRSWNGPGTRACYRGCGPREAREMPGWLPPDEQLATQRSGRTARRG